MEVAGLSGERLARLRLPTSALVAGVKRALQAELGASAFCQRLLLGAEDRPLDDHEALECLARRGDAAGDAELLRLTLVRLAHTAEDDAETGRRLLDAAQDGSAGAFEEILRRPTWPDYADEAGRTSLCIASDLGRADVARLLCEAGADRDRAEPLVIASQRGHLEVVHLLCEWGADKDIGCIIIQTIILYYTILYILFV